MFDCIVLIRLMRASCSDEMPVGVTEQALSRCLLVILPLLAIEQLIASLLIVPKHQPSYSRGASDTAMLGLRLYLVGIGIQEVIVVYTSALTVILHRSLTNREVEKNQTTTTDPSDQASKRWRSILHALLFSLGAISTRIFYRLVELSGFFTGYLLVLAHNEVFFYTFECLPVLTALGVWAMVDTEDLLGEQTLESTPVGDYRYYRVSRELVDTS